MKALAVFFICAGVIASCKGREVENPGADAKTFSEEEFVAESGQILKGSKAKKSGITVEIASFKDDNFEFKVSLPEKIVSSEDLEASRKAIRQEINSIDAFLKKYEGYFRLRYKDGDLKLMSLKEESLKNLENLKQKWTEALKNLEERQPV